MTTLALLIAADLLYQIVPLITHTALAGVPVVGVLRTLTQCRVWR